MKNLLYTPLLWLTFSFGYFTNAQIINVNNANDPESFYSPEQLINEVLISGDCAETQNVSTQVKGLPTQIISKSYGYFKKPANSPFPFNEGLILTSGQAQKAGYPVIAESDVLTHVNYLPGDLDLQAALGINDTRDATFFQFHFTPQSEQISFRYVMASEEYDQTTECFYTDGFAFLLKEVGSTNYINLAVLPDGTPISVTNINNAPGCRSNSQYFDGYEPSTTNYGGHTKVLTAHSEVTPGVLYEIKLVVADQGDAQWDSAIFLEAGSFDLGGDLGEDQTIANGNPGCLGTPILLESNLSNTNFKFEWFKNNTLIPNETSSSLEVSTNGIYAFKAETDDGCKAEDDVIIEFVTAPVIVQSPEPILLCETDNDQTEAFDFSANAALVLGTQSPNDFIISYHPTEIDANVNASPLAVPYTNSLPMETIWLRIADLTQNCYQISSFEIEVQQRAVAHTVTDYELCDNADDGDSNNGIVSFDLSTQIQSILGTQPQVGFEVNFYSSQAHADAGTPGTELPLMHENTINPQTLFARVEATGSPSCYATTSLNLVVNEIPILSPEITLEQCDSNNDGITIFNLTEANGLISMNHLQETFSFHNSLNAAVSGQDPISDPMSYTNTTATNDIVFARVVNASGCFQTAKVNLKVGVTQLNNSFHLTYEVCDDTQLDNDDTNGVATFDFGDATAQIMAELPSGQNLNVSYYESESDALSEQNAISDITNYRNENAPHTQNIYVRVESEDLNACMGLGHHITLNVKPLPVKQLIPNYIQCGPENTASFDLSTVTPDVIGAQTEPLYVSYHFSEQDAIDNNPILNPEVFINSTNPQIIFVRVHYDQNNNQQLDQGECLRTDLNFNLEVEAPPVLKTPDLLVKCSNSFEAEFDLTEREGQITDGDETLVVSYYKSAMDLQNNNPILNPTQYLSEQQFKTILVQAEWPSKCTSIVELELEVLLYAQLNNNPDPIEDCESDNDGLDIFDLTLREAQIVNNSDLSMFEFSYYELENEANLGTANSIPDPTSFINTTPFNQTIFIRIKQLGSPCFQIIALDILVNQGPETALEDRYLICFDADYQLVTPSGETLLSSPPMDTGLDPNIYDFQWYAGTQEEVINDPELFVLDGETNPSLTTIQEGVYTVVVTNQLTGCEMSISALLIKSSPPEEIMTKILQPHFTSPNAVEVLVTGAGKYQYALEDGPWQEENIFANLGYGEHRISVRDRLGCAFEEITINILDYPKYFTPNGDGYHDTWNISSLKPESNAKIYIFDRYGKLLKEIRSSIDGWDGTFNGIPMPSNDYWFSVEYQVDGLDKLKQFEAHFTLKR